jgi:N-succinyldiaminopimelate aminotransferase
MTRTLSRRVEGFGTTIFSEFSALAARSGAINLGQGFPDFDGPDAVREAAVEALRGGVNQYAQSPGAPSLRRAIAQHAQRFHGHAVDADTMVTVTSGATEALLAAILGLVDPGEEVVLFEPAYDSYAASVLMAGAVPRYVRLHPPDAAHPQWWYAPDALRRAFSPRTRLVVVNTPHNPTGKVFTRQELEELGALCEEFDALLLSDEVYEHLVYAPARHVRPATLPALAPRTVTVSSAGKTFSFTGWKVGWAIAPPPLRDAVQRAHQFITFATASPLQEAVATALALPDAFFAELAEGYRARRDAALGALTKAGLHPYVPEGSYFILADLSRLGVHEDVHFCRWLTTEVKVAAIPLSPFYGEAARERPPALARFAFCKTDEVLAEAGRRLAKGLAQGARGPQQ